MERVWRGESLYSDRISFSGMMDDVDLVLWRLRWEVERWRGGRGGRRRSGMTMLMVTVWEMETTWTTADRRWERRK